MAETVVCGRENCPLNLRGAAAVWVSRGSAVAEMNGAAIHIYIYRFAVVRSMAM